MTKTIKRKNKNRKTRRRQYGGAKKNIMEHIGRFFESESHPGVYFSPNESDVLSNNKALVIGPRYPKQGNAEYISAKYPYEGCLFFFNMGFPNDYPNSSPNMIFANSYFFTDNFRYHPNLYEGHSYVGSSGKVCLSILGTWAGPGWEKEMNIESVLTTVQSLLGPNPIHNEPAFTGLSDTDGKLISYNHAVCYRSIKFTIDVYKMILTKSEDSLNDNIKPFIDDIKPLIFSTLKFFLKKLANLKRLHPEPFKTDNEVHHRSIEINYDTLYDEVFEIFTTLPEELKVSTNSENTSVREEEERAVAASKQRILERGINKGHVIKGAPASAASASAASAASEHDELQEMIDSYEMAAKVAEESGDKRDAHNLRRQAQKLRNSVHKELEPEENDNPNFGD